jgi:acyl-CoA thioesterase FadM
MERIKLNLANNFSFFTSIPIRITDLNYGGHVGNDVFLVLIHEARQQFLKYFGYAELNFAGVSLIMADAAIEYKTELNYGDIVKISVAAVNFDRIGFDLHYLLEIEKDGQLISAGKAKTGMICYNYDLKKKVSFPEEARLRLVAGFKLQDGR